ncbi:DUF1501 domain-containing protein [Ideonella oryzae]|uniref:DUF1501 domain-containing protein n=1 Tax=Ideonella oryzae TaxID=2937441 RepID=A0ABT1BNW7_9BURK|nr:DUF1501 domain-containing protein [Ideonella oryzae]MCO5977913.1 DUF1501 domain-containing protein [Ideonella oryzae]
MTRMAEVNRRQWLGAMAAAAATATTRLSWAGSAGQQQGRVVFIILRGGLDGLFAVPATGDPAFAPARDHFTEQAGAALPLDATFGLHPALAQMHALYRGGELLVVHATGLAYHQRSHFDAQQVLESGGEQPGQLHDGWLGRALAATRRSGLAMTTAVPLVLRGWSGVDTWAPSRLPSPTDDLLARLQHLYAEDAALGHALGRARGLQTEVTAAASSSGDGAMGMAPGKGPAGDFVSLCQAAGALMARPEGPQVVVLDVSGWDSHADQAAPNGLLTRRLGELDQGVAALRSALMAPGAGDAWQRSAVVVATEFGRTVDINGTRGTDHGTGGAAWVLGGRVQGGRVLADWPGLAPAQRFEGRDLHITLDIRAVLKGVLGPQLGLGDRLLAEQVFPGSAALKPAPLWRA